MNLYLPILTNPDTFPVDIRARKIYEEDVAFEREAAEQDGRAQPHRPFPQSADITMEYWAHCYVESDIRCMTCDRRIRKNAARLYYRWPAQYAMLCLECGVAHGWFGFFNARQDYVIDDQDGVLTIVKVRPLKVYEGLQPQPVSPHRQPLRAYRAAKRRIARRQQQERAA